METSNRKVVKVWQYRTLLEILSVIMKTWNGENCCYSRIHFCWRLQNQKTLFYKTVLESITKILQKEKAAIFLQYVLPGIAALAAMNLWKDSALYCNYVLQGLFTLRIWRVFREICNTKYRIGWVCDREVTKIRVAERLLGETHPAHKHSEGI